MVARRSKMTGNRKTNGPEDGEGNGSFYRGPDRPEAARTAGRERGGRRRWRARAPLIGPATSRDGTSVPYGTGHGRCTDRPAAVARDQAGTFSAGHDCGSPLSSNQ